MKDPEMEFLESWLDEAEPLVKEARQYLDELDKEWKPTATSSPWWEMGEDGLPTDMITAVRWHHKQTGETKVTEVRGTLGIELEHLLDLIFEFHVNQMTASLPPLLDLEDLL